MSEFTEQNIKLAPSLDLPALQVERFYTPKDGGELILLFANVKKDWRPADGCPYCHSHALILSGRCDPRCVRDVVRNNYRVNIILQSPRMTCGSCGKRFSPKIDGIMENGTMTERLVDFVKTESFLQTHSDLEERTGLSITTIQNIMDEEIERYEDMRKANPLVAPKVLGIDEKHIVKLMRGTIVDVENGKLLDMTENNHENSMKEAIRKLDGWEDNIKVVTTDMSNHYLSWLPSFLPDATIVIDKFHVIQDITQRIRTVTPILYNYRKELISNITDPAERATQTAILKLVNDNKRLFNYSMESVTRDTEKDLSQKLATVISEFPEFMLLRSLYYGLENMYTKTTREEAEKAWDEWQKELPPSDKKGYMKWCEMYSVDESCFDAFRSFNRSAFTVFKPYILNYFNPGCRFTNATTKGLNNLIGRINTLGNGYRFKHLSAKALYTSLLRRRVVYSINMKSIKAWKPNYDMGFSSFDSFDGRVSTHKAEKPEKRYDFRTKNINVDLHTDDLLNGTKDIEKILRRNKYHPKPLADTNKEWLA